MRIVLTTAPDQAAGEELARKLVDNGLAACVQVMPRMTSFYLWEGKIEKDEEHLLLIKTLPEKFDEVAAFIAQNHSYEVPEIAAIDADRVAEPYLSWLKDSLADR